MESSSSKPATAKRAPRTKKATATPTEEVTVTILAQASAPVPSLLVEEMPSAPAPTVPAPSASRSKKKPSSGAAAARKPPVVATVTPDGIVGSLTSTEPRPLIAHMPIRMSDIECDLFASVAVSDFGGTVNMVTPFDASDRFVSFNSGGGADVTSVTEPDSEKEMPSALLHEEKAQAPTVGAALSRPSLPMYYSEKLMIRYLDANRDQRLPETTEVACFWDCHAFRGAPCVIPVKIQEDIWHVYGNFCCPECAAAYLFHERLDSHVQWERYALLNRLYAGGASETVRLASPRAVLRLFGGNLDITEYRSLVGEKRMRVDVMTPPMISITQVMDTKPIDFYDATVKNNFIPWEMDRMNRPGAQGLRLRRTKPIAEKEATLEWCMGIKTV